MAFSLKLHRDVEKQLLKFPPGDRQRLAGAMRSLRDEPRPPRAVQLEQDLYRLRVGDYRILYAVFDDLLVVFVCRAARRSEATYRDLAELIARTRAQMSKP
jgi:mRNA interferase RelE/StbE